MRKQLYAYAWDFADEGVDAVLDRVKSLGMDGVAIAVSYHAGKFILPHNPKRKVYFPEDGTVYFAPHMDRYGRVKPEPASVVRSSDVLAAVADGCRQRGLALTAWTVFMHNTRLGTKHPELTITNAYGDRLPYTLCPAQSDASDYTLGLVDDLTDNYDLDTIFLEALGFLGFAHGFHHEFFGIRLSACRQALLNICFCDACKARAAQAGIDAERAADMVRAHVAPAFEADMELDDCTAEELAAERPELGAYLRMRCEIVLETLAKVKEIADRRGVKVDYFGPSPCSRALTEGTNISRAAALVDHYVIPVTSPNVAQARSDIGCVKSSVAAEKILLSINLTIDNAPTRQNFADKMRLIAEHNLAGCNIYNYSMAPLSRLDWLKG